MALYYDEILAGNCFGQINVTPTPSITDSTNIVETKRLPSPVSEFGYTTEELYYKARKFVKEKKEQIQLKYGDNIRLIALSKQEKLGKWNASYTRNVGFLDVVGNDRKQAWIALGDMTKEQAMEEYVKLLLDRCSIFRIHLQIQDVKYVVEDQSRQDYDTCRQLEQAAEKARQYELEQVLRLEKQKKKREDLQRKQIQDALNQQTYSQFKAYAEQQYKDNRAAQEDLIRQLQEQHFHKYMQQVYQQQLIDQQLRAKATMEQTSENITLSSVPPSNAVPLPSTLANTVIPPPLVNVVPTNIVTTSSPTIEVPSTNMELPPASLNSSIALQVLTRMPPLGSAPTKLPPLVHPPPPPLISNANASVQDMKIESAIPVQAKFETLNLDTPMELIRPAVSQPSMSNDPAQQSSSSGEITNELSAAQVPMGSNQLVPASLTEPNGTVNSNNESTLPSEQETQELPNIITANMWTRKDIKEFKDQIRKEKDAVIKIGSGETVTVRVPTHEDGNCIFWEFSTDYYDLGFGVYFEWNKAESNTVTVHVSDSSDEEDEHEDGEKKDIEKGSGSTNKPPKPRQSEIVPIYRRDCHEEVYAGSHQYPGVGVYLLKFDNSYSLWRSKTLYYRVYYSK
ncbi:unnamed protein product [Rotaria socialis]|uniref:Golgi resident protein GCP60 n=1 Tax=Rotaria socialis TaxID=392032 RepID=A0A818HYE2_9BILA|nr:unnamed protein product [Rotaria socialis]